MMQFITSRLRLAEVFVALRSVWEGWGMSIECNISKSGPKRPENGVYFGIFGSAIPHECVCLASIGLSTFQLEILRGQVGLMEIKGKKKKST